jgi:hypothetical protein
MGVDIKTNLKEIEGAACSKLVWLRIGINDWRM